ncbi:lysyl oxidase homolog 3B isoform X3 [Salmo salar]|uniref:Lysyl oxidase homolog n=1 Tax=Salmo salar TaxID=8030 RepID=A0A1S3SS51_SALSA|nr:lysyl oxidase homolog 3B isoform X3 [Salmo salar]|eukprot:XP_014067167.1 PREDICTED: lysyl oxidase homolog 3-like isoform X2 [Salmo salar]
MKTSRWWQRFPIISFLLGVWLPAWIMAQTTPPTQGTTSPKPQNDRLQFRLVGYPRKHNEGRIEVFYKGEWGTICDDDFSLSNANVLCRQLGFVSATGWTHSAKYGKGLGKIWLDNVQCNGGEKSIELCKSRGWGNSDCTHDEDAGVICKDERLPGFVDSNVIDVQVDEDRVEEVRLRSVVPTKKMPVTEGVVEIKYKDGWAQICDVGWTPKNTRVICGMLGFPHERKVNKNFYKARLRKRAAEREARAKVNVSAAARLPPKANVKPITSGLKKRLPPKANVKPITSGLKKRLNTERQKHQYRLHSVACVGTEVHLAACPLESNKGNATGSCDGGMPAVVSCVPGPQYVQNNGLKKKQLKTTSTVRLKGGAKLGEGRVEVLKNNEWGTVCDDRWTLLSASVVCRELGFGSAKEALTGARMGEGMGPIHMNEVQCLGTEKSMWNCGFKNITSEDCQHLEDAAVRCNTPYMALENSIRLTGGRTRYEGRVEVLSTEANGTGSWGLICGGAWGTKEAMVACRQLGLGYANNGLQVRIVGGRTYYEGRVEVQVGERWGTVCSAGWTTKEAMVACRQLGLGYSMHAITETWYWDSSNVTEMVMSGVKCTGSEMSLSHCHHHRTISCQKTAAKFSAGVICSETASDLVLNAPLVQQSVYIEDRPLHMLYCAAEENCLSKSAASANWPYGHRRLLRFSSQIHNIGRADFRPKAGRHSWVWHACHGHYHSMDIFTHYDLLSSNGTKVAEGHKASFCLEDTECHEGISKRYECANFGEQGITVGCWDLYRHDIDCQWIDITDIKPGNYILQIVINPNFEVAESDFTNNAMKCNCKYDGHRIWLHNCHMGDAFSEEAERKFEKYPGQLNNQIS